MKYHIIRVNDKTKTKVYMTDLPIDHNEACVLISRINTWTQFPYLRTLLEEVQS